MASMVEPIVGSMVCSRTRDIRANSEVVCVCACFGVLGVILSQSCI